MRQAGSLFILFAVLSVCLLVLLGTWTAGVPPMGDLLDPKNGLYRTARLANQSPPSSVEIPGLTDRVQIIWDDRYVPHIYTADQLDAVAALGYVHAYHRLFQIDFIPRAASGRLSEALGDAAVPADRFLRRTGMDWGARRNLARIRRENGTELEILEAYCRGVNAYLRQLSEEDLPFEFRLLGYEPEPCTPLQSIRVLQYMNFDLSYRTDRSAYAVLRERLDPDDYDLLYPQDPAYSVPIIPQGSAEPIAGRFTDSSGVRALVGEAFHSSLSSLLEGYLPGKGSNNWAVTGDRSATGTPILAGDMHLAVTLPAIWYEAHIVTPEANLYGVSIPGAPAIVEGFNSELGWAFTNTGSDQIDHYLLQVDSTRTRYRHEGAWHDMELVQDTIRVNRADHVLDTLRYSHWGPVTKHGGEWVAEQWVAHDSSRTLLAIWKMGQARNHDEFQDALRYWDTPMQNILYADREGTISIRSTGYLPIRRGGSGSGLLDGTSPSGAWTGRVPFDELPYAENPAQGFLTSTNQKPTDATYAYYLGHEWSDKTYRSIRIDTLLRSRAVHTFEDLRGYQADVYAVQRDFFVPLIDSLTGLTARADSLRAMLASWDGEMTLDQREPTALHYFLEELAFLAWDESVFDALLVDALGDSLPQPFFVPKPAQTRLYQLLSRHPSAKWLDMKATEAKESAADLLRHALEGAAGRLESAYGWNTPAWRWGDRHGIRFNHLISALPALGRGPVAYPGYDDTLSPASDTLATHSASWRVIVDFSTSPPRAQGVYPGGQSGNPFSRFYDLHLPAYISFRYYDLLNVADEDALPHTGHFHRTVVKPALE